MEQQQQRRANSFPTRPECQMTSACCSQSTMFLFPRRVCLCSCPVDRAVSSDESMACCFVGLICRKRRQVLRDPFILGFSFFLQATPRVNNEHTPITATIQGLSHSSCRGQTGRGHEDKRMKLERESVPSPISTAIHGGAVMKEKEDFFIWPLFFFLFGRKECVSWNTDGGK